MDKPIQDNFTLFNLDRKDYAYKTPGLSQYKSEVK